jgi:hypothetical protein
VVGIRELLVARAENRTIRVEGPIFDPRVVQNLHEALGEGIKELGEEGEGILMSFIARAGFEQSGRFLRSATSEQLSKAGHPDASTVTVTDDWKHMGAGRPTKTWFERGYRNGVRLRKGGWGFKNTATRMRAMNFDEFFRDKIARALG